jgi:hypothetical protein
MVVVAAVGAVIAIVAQRKIRPTEGLDEGKGDMWWRGGLAAAMAGWRKAPTGSSLPRS